MIDTSKKLNKNNHNPSIFLAGDSTVKTYDESTFIAGWGQYLNMFLKDVNVYNCAHGGRSSRMFINEGRLYNIQDCKFVFDQNQGKSIEDTIKKGDYLFIQFGHNDDSTKINTLGYSTIYDRMTPVGIPDKNGIYPKTPGYRVDSKTLPLLYKKYASLVEQDEALKNISLYGATYYSYDCGGTFKWYLKQYIDFARSKDATPVLITPVARINFEGDKIIGGEGCHGKKLEYVEAVRQLAKEEDCILIDLYKESKKILEIATPTYAHYLMSLKPNDLMGVWPTSYDAAYNNPKLGCIGIENTHYNKYGAYLIASRVSKLLKDIKGISDHVLSNAIFKVLPPTYIPKDIIDILEKNI